MTAVEWLIEELTIRDRFVPDFLEQQAKEKEYKQNMECIQRGMELQEKENNRVGFRERNGLLSSQTEISDEEIEKAVNEYANVYQCPSELKMCKHDVISAWNNAIKWYREQLKKKQ